MNDTIQEIVALLKELKIKLVQRQSVYWSSNNSKTCSYISEYFGKIEYLQHLADITSEQMFLLETKDFADKFAMSRCIRHVRGEDKHSFERTKKCVEGLVENIKQVIYFNFLNACRENNQKL